MNSGLDTNGTLLQTRMHAKCGPSSAAQDHRWSCAELAPSSGEQSFARRLDWRSGRSGRIGLHVAIAMRSALQIDPRALREQLALVEQADVHSTEFLRFVVRLSEALDRDIPAEDYGQLSTLAGSISYVRQLQELARVRGLSRAPGSARR
jgi:acyl carrier protein